MYSFTGNEYIEKAVENYSDAMLNAAYSILKSTADAEDVVQEAFLKYIRKRPVFNSDEHEKAWLIRVTINTAKDMLKSYERKNLPICEDILYNQIDESQNTSINVLECVFKLEEKYRGLPKGCWRCKYLNECRRPKEEGWKCYDGCRIIKEKQRTGKNITH